MGSAWLSAQMDYVWVWHGLAFALAGQICFARARCDPSAPWRLLGAFCAAQAASRALEIADGCYPEQPLLLLMRLALLGGSYLCLLEFARRGWRSGFLPSDAENAVGVVRGAPPGFWVHPAALALPAAAGLARLGSPDVLLRVALGVPVAMIAGALLVRTARRGATAHPAPLRIAGVVLIAHVVVAAFASVCDSRPMPMLGGRAPTPPVLVVLLVVLQPLAAGILAVALAVAQRSAEVRLSALRFRVMLASALLLLTGGWLASSWSGDAANKDMRERILSEAEKIAEAVRPNLAATLSFTPQDRSRPAFQRIRRQLMAYGRIIEQRSIYTIALRGDQILFGPENLAEDDPMASPPGTLYVQPPPATWEVLRTGVARTSGPVADEYGTFVSAFAPVRELHGNRVLLAVGVDVLADDWQIQIARRRLSPLLITMLLAGILLHAGGLAARPQRAPPRSDAHLLYSDVALLGISGLVLTATAALGAHELELDARRTVFAHYTDCQAAAVHQLLTTIRDQQLPNLVRFFEASEAVHRDEFSIYAGPAVRGAAVRAIAWSPRVPREQIHSLETKARAEGLSGFVVHGPDAVGESPSGEQAKVAHPVLFVQPERGNEDLLGFDLNCEPARRAAIEESERSGLPTATGPISDAGGERRDDSILICHPVLQRAGAARESGSPIGFVSVLLRLDAVLDAALADQDRDSSATQVTWLQLRPDRPPQLLASWPDRSESPPSAALKQTGRDLTAVLPLFEFGNCYALVIRPGPGFLHAYPASAAWMAGVLGLVLTCAVTGLAGAMSYRRVLLQRDIIARTQALEATRRANDIAHREEARATALLQLSHMTDLSPDEIAEAALDAGISLTDSEIGYIAFASEDESTLRIVHWSGQAMEQCSVVDRPLEYAVKDTGLWGEAVRQRGPVITNDYAAEDVRKKGLPPGHVPIRRHMNVPIFDGDRIVAVAGVGNKQAPYTSQDVTELSLLMDGLWRILRRKQAEDALRESEQRHRTLYETSRDAILTVLADNQRITGANPAAVGLFGAPSEADLLGKTLLDFSTEIQSGGVAAPDRIAEVFETALREGSHFFEWQHKRLNGEEFVADVLLTRVQLGDRRLVQSTVRDITDRKRAEKALRLQSSALEAAANGIVLTDRSGRISWVNPAFTRLTGYSSEEVIGARPSLLKSGCHEPDFYRQLWATILSGRVWTGEMVNRRKDGSHYTEEMTITGVTDESGEATHFVAVKQDITLRKQSEQALLASEAHFRRLYESMTAVNRIQQDLLGPGELTEKLRMITAGAVQLFDLDFCRIWVVRPGDLCESGCVHAVAQDEPHACRDRSRCLHLLASSGRYTHTDGPGHRRVPFGCYKIGLIASGEEHKFLTNDVVNEPRVHGREWARELGLISFAGYQLHPPGCATMGVLALFSRHEITPELDALLESLANAAAQVIQSARAEEEQRSLQSQLIQAQRLESVGQLAAGIAHEINTPTQFVSDNTRFMRTAFPKLAGLLREYEQLVGACRTGSVSQQLLDRLELGIKQAKLGYMLEQIPEALSDSLDGLERVAVIVRAMKDFAHPGRQSMAPADLNRAIESTVTVARNEWKYVADVQLDLDPSLPPAPCLLGEFNQAVLNILVNATHAVQDVVGEDGREKGTITISTRLDGDHIEIRVRDTGTGIPVEHRSRIFEHFFTTKEVGKGTGQGLAIAWRTIVEKHHGTLTFETELGRGTTFIIRLPTALEEPDSGESVDHDSVRSARR